MLTLLEIENYFSFSVNKNLFFLETNVIPDNTINGQIADFDNVDASPQCVICEFVMKEIEDELQNKNNQVCKDKVEQCSYLNDQMFFRKTLKRLFIQFVIICHLLSRRNVIIL